MLDRQGRNVARLSAAIPREGDLSLLIDHLLRSINANETPGVAAWQKKLSAEGKNFLLRQPWLGNVRELQNRLTRAAIWSSGSTMTLDDIRDALLDMPSELPDCFDILGVDAGGGLFAAFLRHPAGRAGGQGGGRRRRRRHAAGLALCRSAQYPLLHRNQRPRFDAGKRVINDKGVVAKGEHQVGKVFFANYQNLDEELDGKKVFQHYDPDFFDLVVIDECHRSGFGDWFGVLEHFGSALQLGLTASLSVRCAAPSFTNR